MEKPNGIHIHIAENGLVIEDCKTGGLYNCNGWIHGCQKAMDIIKERIGRVEYIPPDIKQPPEKIFISTTLKDALNKCKKELIIQTLKITYGNKTEAAKILGVQRTYLSRLVTRYNLNGSLNKGASHEGISTGHNTG